MSDKTGKLYENLTQVIFETILGQKQFPNLKVERDIFLQGKTASHQIDVYWKFAFGGVPHEVIVQAKDWNRSVELGYLLTFKGVLDDLPGQPRGIYVTRSGYQSGAREFGLAHGILLYELREADYPPPLPITSGGWAWIGIVPMPLHGIVTVVGDLPADTAASAVTFGFVFDIYTPKWTEIRFVISADWFKKEYPECGLVLPKGFKFVSVANHERLFLNHIGENIGNLGTITAEIIEGIKKDYVDKKQVTRVFDPPVYITTGDAHLPRVVVSSVSITVEIEHMQCVRRGMSNISELVLHQLNSDEKWWFAATPQVIEKLSKTKNRKFKHGRLAKEIENITKT